MGSEARRASRQATRAAAKRTAQGAAAKPVAQAPPPPPPPLFGGKPQKIEDAIVIHVKRDVGGVPGNDGVQLECRGSVRPTEIPGLLAQLTSPRQ